MARRTFPSLRLLRRFARARRGAAALELALVAVPFFLLTIGLAEIAMIGFAQTSLDSAVSQTARQIRTGQAQMGSLDRDDIAEMMCNEVTSFLVLECDGNLVLDVARFDSFVDADADNPDAVSDEDQFEPPSRYEPGLPSEIVVVRAYYRWEIMSPLFGPVFETINGSGERILVATMMFRNEPYQASGGGVSS